MKKLAVKGIDVAKHIGLGGYRMFLQRAFSLSLAFETPLSSAFVLIGTGKAFSKGCLF